MEAPNCPFCKMKTIQILDKENQVYKCLSGHVWRVCDGDSIELQKLSKRSVSARIAAQEKKFTKELTIINMIDPTSQGAEIIDDDLKRLREGLFSLISDRTIEAYVDPDNHIHFVITKQIIHLSNAHNQFNGRS